MTSTQPAAGSPLPSSQPETSPLTVIGWLIVCFAIIPLLMGARGEGQALLFGGGGLIAVGIVLVLVGRGRYGRRDSKT